MGGVGPGLSPGPWSFELLYDHAIYIVARQLCAHGFITHSPWFLYIPYAHDLELEEVGTVLTVSLFVKYARSYGPYARELGG